MARDMPTGVIIIGILLIISGLSNTIGGVFTTGSNAGVLVISIMFGLFTVIVGICLMLGQNWARITAMVLSGLSIFNGLLYIMMGASFFLVNVILNVIILLYLALNRNVKAAFRGEDDHYGAVRYGYVDEMDYYAEVESSPELYTYEEEEPVEVMPAEPGKPRITFKVK